MPRKNAPYIFASENLAKDYENLESLLYGWVWNNVSIVVGSLPSETAHQRIQDINTLNLQLVGDNPASLLPLTILSPSDLSNKRPDGSIWIVYRTPNLRAQRFYTVQPLQLNLVPSSNSEKTSAASAQLEAVINANPVALQLPTRENVPSMDEILSHVNVSSVVEQLVQGTLKSSPVVVPAGSNQSVSSRTFAPSWRVPEIIKHLAREPLTFLVAICNLPVPLSYSGSTLAKDISAALQQADVRLEQLLKSKEQFESTRLENVQNIARSTARYINFFNCVWLIINDIIIGLAVGGFICDNRLILARMITQFIQRHFIELLHETLHWLDNWPVGLKLNTELSRFLCNTFAAGITYWGAIIGIQASLETVLAFLNHFPLFALMLRAKDPARLPGGIELHIRRTMGVLAVTQLKLVNKPIPFSRIFFQHRRFIMFLLAAQH
ncbi:N-acetylglucosaminyl transferase component Gpi1 [Ceratobasidium sp. AG-Ba]|nr:N-acetylglucosaminyl transferase component Gpi1 [Ceratobasidium sp. AG-Ba]